MKVGGERQTDRAQSLAPVTWYATAHTFNRCRGRMSPQEDAEGEKRMGTHHKCKSQAKQNSIAQAHILRNLICMVIKGSNLFCHLETPSQAVPSWWQIVLMLCYTLEVFFVEMPFSCQFDLKPLLVLKLLHCEVSHLKILHIEHTVRSINFGTSTQLSSFWLYTPPQWI